MEYPPPALDGQRLEAVSNSQQWVVSWHAPSVPPPGRNHGSAGICVTAEGMVVLVTEDGDCWELPAGRPEDQETLEDTLRREIWEEACAEVEGARLLGFAQGECVEGHELGLVLVRSFWRAEVTLHPWEPQCEILHRRLVLPAEVIPALALGDGNANIHARALIEAGFE